MTALRLPQISELRAPAHAIVAGLAFLFLFWQPLITLGRDWWTNPDAGHGLLLAPLALVLAWKKGLVPAGRGQVVLGLLMLATAVLMRYVAGLAAELFIMRVSLLWAAAGLIVYARGIRQLVHWWLPVTLLVLSIPLPSVVLSSLALPLQLKASALGAALLEARDVPVQLTGNVIHLPRRSLFVTEACSGLRSLTALTALGVLIGGLWIRTVPGRIAILVLTLPVAIALNALRIFLTGFLVYYVDPALAEGVMHYSEGWVIFVVAFAILAGIAVLVRMVERWRAPLAEAPA